jgi:hypothetical protein
MRLGVAGKINLAVEELWGSESLEEELSMAVSGMGLVQGSEVIGSVGGGMLAWGQERMS